MILLRFQIYCFRYQKTLCTKLKAWFLFSKELSSEAVEFWPEHLVTSFLAVYLLAERIRGGLPTLNTVFTRFLRLRFFLFFLWKYIFQICCFISKKRKSRIHWKLLTILKTSKKVNIVMLCKSMYILKVYSVVTFYIEMKHKC